MTQGQMIERIYYDVQDLKQEMCGFKGDVQGVKDDVQSLKDDVQGLKDDVQGLKDDVQVLKDDMQIMKDDMQSLNNRVTGLELTIENEIRRDINIIAESHIELNRKLDKVLMKDAEKEDVEIRVDILEKDVRVLKAKVG